MNEELVHQGIYDLLTSEDAPARISELVGDRIYPIEADEGADNPYLAYSLLTEDFTTTKDGPVPNGWVFQVSAYADRALTANRLANSIRKAIDFKTIDLVEFGTLRFRATDRADQPFDPEKQLFETVLEFRARKIA